jgi:hypothetical protein
MRRNKNAAAQLEMGISEKMFTRYGKEKQTLKLLCFPRKGHNKVTHTFMYVSSKELSFYIVVTASLVL